MNEIKDIVDAYNEEVDIYEAKEKKIKQRIERAEKQLAKLKYPTRSNRLIVPLAKALMEKCGFLYYEIYGPFGITSETTLYLSNIKGKNGGIDICEVETWSLTFQWRYDNNKLIPLVWTGESSGEYREGTIGYYNGMNHVLVPLPDDIDEVVKMLHHSTKDEK